MSGSAFALYLARRLAAMALLLGVISFVIFSLLYIAPGDPLEALLASDLYTRTPEQVKEIEHKYHLDEPFFKQYWIWLGNAVQLDFGEGIVAQQPVTEVIQQRLPISLFLGVYAYVLKMILGIGLGVIAALKKRTGVDRAIVGGVIVGLSMPTFVSGILLIYLFAVVLPWFPAFGAGEGFLDRLEHMTLPAVALALVGSALITKHTRASMINVVDQDYVGFARARGLSYRKVLFSYAFRNALIPVVTVSGIVLGLLITGAVLTEVTFSIPGVGSLLVASANANDVPMLQGIAMLTAAVIMSANLLADLTYMVVDPRIRLGRRTT